MLEKIKLRKIEKLADFYAVYKNWTKSTEIGPDDFETLDEFEPNKKYGCLKVSDQFVFYFNNEGEIQFKIINFSFDQKRNGDSFKLLDTDENKAWNYNTNFEKAKFLCDSIESQKDKNLDNKKNIMIHFMQDTSKYYAFEGITQTLCQKDPKCSNNLLFPTDMVYSNLKQIKTDINEMPLKNFIEKYEGFNETLTQCAANKTKKQTKRNLTSKKVDEIKL